MKAELEAMAKTLYDYWFVQYDYPDKNGKPYKSSGGKMVWNADLKREVPEVWEVGHVKDIANSGSGGTPLSTKNEYYENGTILWKNSGEVNSPYIISTEKFITQKGLDDSSVKLFPANSILMAMYDATEGKVSLLKFEVSTSQAICAILPFEKCYTYYLKLTLEDVYRYLVNLSTGSARDNLSQDKIKSLTILIAHKQILQKFHSITKSLFDKIEPSLIENQELTTLRNWLLPMLMNGQVRVKGAGVYEMREEELGMVAEE